MTAALFGAVLIASLVGSLHCVGMCGGFVAAVSGAHSDRSEHDRLRAQAPLLAYQGTRGLAYVTLGALAGLLGAGLVDGATWIGISSLAGPLMGLTLIALAIASVWPSTATPLVSLGAKPMRPGLLAGARLQLTAAVRRRGALAGAAAGLLSALLPCGWLWAYVVVAASTGAAWSGATVMAVFWLGSVPALLGVGLMAGTFARRFARHAPRVNAVILLALGLLSLAGKLTPAPVLPQTRASPVEITEPTSVPTEAPCH